MDHEAIEKRASSRREASRRRTRRGAPAVASTTDEEARPKRRRRRREVDVDALESRLGLTFDEEEEARVSRVVRRLSPSGLEFAADL